jgi:(2S)-methylsuccinyl-CoA dehydrogenase
MSLAKNNANKAAHQSASVSEDAGFTLAVNCIGTTEELLNLALCNVKKMCSVNGVVDPAKIDLYQLASYELVFCTAELSAAQAIVQYAALAKQDDALCADLALSFTAEALNSIKGRLTSIAVDVQLERDLISQYFSTSDAQVFLNRYLTARNLALLGEKIIERSSNYLPSMLGEEIDQVRESFARFADEVVSPQAEKMHREDLDIPEEILSAAIKLGCFGTSIPERFGGLQPDDHEDCTSMIVVTEELSRASLSVGSLITRSEIASRALLAGGTQAQQNKWLPQLASGEQLCAVSVTEPNTGSDVASVMLKATKTQGGWLLNGGKTWCTFAGKATVLLTLARTEPGLGYKGLSLFLVEKPSQAGHSIEDQQDAGGRLIGKAIATIGYRGMHSYELFFENYFVSDSNLIGEAQGQGKGFYLTMNGFSGGRIQTAARATGVMQAAFDKALSYAKDRNVFGKRVADYQLTQVKIARMLSTLTASRQFSYAVARQMNSGEGQIQASLVKLFTCRCAEWVTREAMQIHGGMGYAEESAVSRYFVDARVLSIFEGAEETLALKVVARELITKARLLN